MSTLNTIFSVGSPVDQLDAESTPNTPAPIDDETFQAESTNLLKKLKPLLQVREEADKVYSDGYFQRHYPEAEKRIKRLLHTLVIRAWANAMNEDGAEEASEGESVADEAREMEAAPAPEAPRSLGTGVKISSIEEE